MYRAVLDTCALVPGDQRDFLLQLAAEEAYAPLWSTGILTELNYVLERLDERKGRSSSSVEQRKRLLDQMNRAFPGASINASREGRYSYDLRDRDDGHVAHAAILGKADAIVTDDSRAGFRTSADLATAEIEVLHPHEFAANTIAAHPRAGLRAIRAMVVRRSNPPQSETEILDVLANRYGMQEVVAILTPLLREE